MFDTPAQGDRSTLYALTDQPSYEPAFPGHYRVSPDLRIGFWVYVSSQSTSGSGPALRAYLGNRGSGAAYGYTWASFDPVRDGQVQPDTWTFVEPTASDAVWRVGSTLEDSDEEISWAGLIERIRGVTPDGADAYGSFEYGFGFEQDEGLVQHHRLRAPADERQTDSRPLQERRVEGELPGGHVQEPGCVRRLDHRDEVTR
jgi:hypothetical protein